MIEAHCPHCKSLDYTALKKIKGGFHFLLVVCTGCGSILGIMKAD